MEIVDLLSTRVVPAELLARMMTVDAGQYLSPDMPPSAEALEELEEQVGRLPDDYRIWILKFGAAATPDESGIIFGSSVSSYKMLGPRIDGALQVATFDEGDDIRFIDSDGGISSTSYDDWFPTFSSFVAAVLCAGNGTVWQQFQGELRALEPLSQ